jgi:hypothetical protein
METNDLIKAWLKENKLSSHYKVNDLSSMIECQYYHSSGINRIRIVDDTAYYWSPKHGEFNKVVLNIADPDFFDKLLTILCEQCANRRLHYFIIEI